MAKRSEFVEHILEQLTGLGYVSSRAMFGGWGIYCDGVMFGLVADDVLYLKVDDENRIQFEEAGLGPFVYESKGKKPVSMSYHEAPDSFYDDPEVACAWGAVGLAAAKRKQAKSPKKKKAAKKKTTKKKAAKKKATKKKAAAKKPPPKSKA